MEKMVVGSVTFGSNSTEYHDLMEVVNERMARFREQISGCEEENGTRLEEVLGFIKDLVISNHVGWNAYRRIDEELQKLKEENDGKKVYATDRRGNRKVGKKVRGKK